MQSIIRHNHSEMNEFSGLLRIIIYSALDCLCGYPHKQSNAELNIMQSNYLQSLIKPMIFFLFTQHNIPYRIPLTNHRKGVPIWSNTR